MGIPIYSIHGIIGEMKEDDNTSSNDTKIVNNKHYTDRPHPNSKKKKKSSNTNKTKETVSNRKPHGRKPPIEDLGIKPKTSDKSTYSIYDDHVETDING